MTLGVAAQGIRHAGRKWHRLTRLEAVGAGLADGREDFLGHPVLELAGLWLVRTHDELVEPAFGDDPL